MEMFVLLQKKRAAVKARQNGLENNGNLNMDEFTVRQIYANY